MATPIASTPGIIIGVGVGAAAAAALEPAVEVQRQEGWQRIPARVLDAGLLARLVAQGGVPLGEAQDEAVRQGYTADKFDRMVYAAQTVPGVAELMFLWRLGVVSEDVWRQGMVKLGQRPDWIDHVAQTFTVPLTAEQVAVMVQRSVIPNQGQLPGYAAPGAGKVPPFPEVEIDGYKSAQAYGVGKDQLDALTRIIGLPASPDLAARMAFRDIITYEDFLRAAAEGNTRVEWAPFLFDGFRHILTAHDYAELQLRGFQTEAERLAGTAKHGMSATDSTLLYNMLGRALGTSAITRGIARGGTYDGKPKTAPEPWLDSLERGNIRPEWYDLAYHYYEYEWPSYFVIRPLAQSGALGPGEVNGILLALGWRPDLCAKITENWTGATLSSSSPPTTYEASLTAWEAHGVATADPHLTKAKNTAWTTAQRSYIAEESTPADVAPIFSLLGIPSAAQTEILSVWDAVRALTRKQLTPADVRKAVQFKVTNPATGQPWTTQDGIAALLARGYDQADAQTFLSE